jgi:DUF4097 and DUF4098 domain-containing protein YvlB
MRRGSLFAPILLIGLGLVFLARNLYPELRLLDYLAKFWPLLLVLWGVLRTAEIVFWASSKQPLPARGITGGEWMLVILLCCFGATLHAVRGFAGWFPGTIELGGLDMFGESYDYPINGEKPTGKTPHVVIESFRGNARIVGTDGSAVKVTGHKTARAIDRDGADRANRETPLEVTGDSGTIIIRTNQNRASGVPRVTEDMEITVPKGASIEAHGRSGDFDIQGIGGAVAITSQIASVRLAEIGGPVRLELTPSQTVRAVNLSSSLELNGSGGDIDLENVVGGVTINGAYTGNVEFHNLSGSIHFKGPQTEFSAERIPGDVRMPLGNFNASKLDGPVRVETRMRDVQISGFTNALEVTVDNGDIELRPTLPLGRMDVHTRSGNITLALPKDARFALTASTGMGSIVNGFGPPLVLDEARRNATLRGTNGGPDVKLRSDRGEITVREASPNEPPFEPRVGPTQLKGLKDFSKKIEQ